MNTRVFLLKTVGFPRRSAPANYTQYLAQALMQIENVTPIVIGIGDNHEEDYLSDKGGYYHKDIEYFNISVSNNILYKKIKYNPVIYKVLENKYHICERDYVIFYNPDYFYIKWLMKRKILVSHIRVCQVEKSENHQFKFGGLNPYRIYAKLTESLLFKYKIKMLPISTFIQKYDEEHDVPTMVLPIMADPMEYEYCPKNHKGQVSHFIYPGIKTTDFEDDIPLLLKSIEQLTNEERDMLMIHFTGTTAEKFMRRYQVSPSILKCLKFHGWLDYHDLINLYKKMNYLLLIRKMNNITRANFPSKVPELLSFGVIPVCTAVGDYTDLYLEDNVNSFQIFEQSDENIPSVIRKAIYLEEKSYLKMQNNARQLAVERFAYWKWSKALKEYIFEE